MDFFKDDPEEKEGVQKEPTPKPVKPSAPVRAKEESAPEAAEVIKPKEPAAKDAVEEIPYNDIPYIHPLTEIEGKENVENPYLPGEIGTEDQYNSLIQQIDNDATLTADRRDELATKLGTLYNATLHGRWKDRFTDGQYAQAIKHNGKLLGTGSAKITLGGKYLSGNEAADFIRSNIGTGRPATGFMWNSGFKIKVGGFTAGEIFDHQVSLLEARESLGYLSNGQIISTDDARMITKMADFILDHVIASTLKEVKPGRDLGKYLSALDLYNLLAVGLEAMYPTGYLFVQDCVHRFDKENPCDWSTIKDVEDINKVVKLDFRYVVHPDKNKLTERQLNIIDRDWNSTPTSDIINYREDFKEYQRLTDSTIVSDGIRYKLVIRDPFYDDYRIESIQMISALEERVDQTLNQFDELGPEETYRRRAQYIEAYVKSLNAQRHSAWVSEIQVVDEASGETLATIGNDPDKEDNQNRLSIIRALGELSRTEGFADVIEKEMTQYKIDFMVAVTGIPDFECPACKRGQSRKLSVRPGIIPIPMTTYFFAIMAFSMSQANIVDRS